MLPNLSTFSVTPFTRLSLTRLGWGGMKRVKSVIGSPNLSNSTPLLSQPTTGAKISRAWKVFETGFRK